MKPENRNLISLKCLLFFFFGGIGCLFPFLPLHMRKAGLTLEEAHIVSIVAPLVATLGPLFAGPLADKLGRNNGNSLRTMIAISMVLAAISYSLLVAIPSVERHDARQPAVSFSCNPNGAAVLQERCMEKLSCSRWTEENVGALVLSKCRYDCRPDSIMASSSNSNDRSDKTNDTQPHITTTSSSFENTTLIEDINDTDYENGDTFINEPDTVAGDDKNLEDRKRRKRHAIPESNDTNPPHLCFRDSRNQVLCHVYSKDSETIHINASLLQATNPSASQDEYCRYPLGGQVWCRIPDILLEPLGHEVCHVICAINEPYTIPGSVLAQSQCQRIIGEPNVTFWSYLIVRSVADIFASAVIALLNTAIVIATRETSCSQNIDIGQQLAFGSLGFAAFSPVVGFINFYFGSSTTLLHNPSYWLAFLVFGVLMLISALLIILAKSMPLGTPEWWWASKGVTTGKTWVGEMSALIGILILLGTFFSALDTYLPWHLSELRATSFFLCLTLTAGALPSIPLLWHSEKVVEYCGHSNLLITAFTFYIIRFTGFSFFTTLWGILLCETLEMFTMSLMWVTAISYIRHMVPRHLTSTGQSMAVIAHFCIGRSLGALFAGFLSQWSDHFMAVYRICAICAGVVASLYFLIYHCCLKARCKASSSSNPSSRAQSTIVQGGPPTNGSYTPLQVYDNGNNSSRNQFRY